MTGSLIEAAPVAMVARRAVIPVITFRDAEEAVPVARALVRGGLDVIEVTLRTDAGLEAIRRMSAEFPEAIIGAGTLRVPGDIDNALRAGAKFLVSPGGPPRLMDAAEDCPVFFLPGASTATEAMSLAERGFSLLKFFPAETSGGTAALRALAGPLPDLRFCPTGGIGPSNASAYLSLPNVVCVGGAWPVPDDAVKSRDWARIEGLAREAAALRG